MKHESLLLLHRKIGRDASRGHLSLLALLFLCSFSAISNAGLLDRLGRTAGEVANTARKIPHWATKIASDVQAAQRKGAGLATRHAILTVRDGRLFLLTHQDGGRYVFHELEKGASVDDVLLAQSTDLIIPESQADALIRLSDDVPARKRYVLTEEGGELIEFQTTNSVGKSALTLHLAGDVKIDVPDPSTLSATLQVLMAKLHRENIRLVSMFHPDEVHILKWLDDAAGDTHRIGGVAESGDFLERIAGAKNRLVVIVGHVEPPDLVVRAPDGSVSQRVAIADIETRLSQHGNSALFLGCGATKMGVSGFNQCVNVSDVANGLKALRHTENFAALLRSIGASADGLVVRSKLIEARRIALVAQRRRDRLDENLDRSWYLARLTTNVQEKRASLSTANTPEVSPLVGFFIALLVPVLAPWFIGLVFGFFSLRQEWRDYKNVYPIQVGALSSSLRRAAFRLVRWISFFFLVPFVIGASYMMMLLGAVFAFVIGVKSTTVFIALFGPFLFAWLVTQWSGPFGTIRNEWRNLLSGLFIPALLSPYDPFAESGAESVDWSIDIVGAVIAAIIGLLWAACAVYVSRRFKLKPDDYPARLVLGGYFRLLRFLSNRTQRVAAPSP